MIIIHKPTFSRQLKTIIEHIALDKPSASMKFKNELKETINLLPDHPSEIYDSIQPLVSTQGANTYESNQHTIL